MDKGKVQDVVIATMTAFCLLPEADQRRLVAAVLRGAGRACRGVAAGAGRAAIRLEKQYYSVFRP